jgi:hypothetical protein
MRAWVNEIKRWWRGDDLIERTIETVESYSSVVRVPAWLSDDQLMTIARVSDPDTLIELYAQKRALFLEMDGIDAKIKAFLRGEDRRADKAMGM